MLLGVGLAELRVEVIELRDHLVQAFRNVLSPLVRLEQLSFEGTDAARLFLDLASQRRGLLALTFVRIRERADGALESLEVIGVSFVRNEGTPRPHRIVPGSEEFSQAAGAIWWGTRKIGVSGKTLSARLDVRLTRLEPRVTVEIPVDGARGFATFP